MSVRDQMVNGQLRGEEKEKEGGEEGDAMMLMANDGNLEDLVSLDVLQNVNNRGNNTLNESRMCKGLLFCENSFMFNRYTNQNFYSLSYDVETDLLVTSTIVSQWIPFNNSIDIIIFYIFLISSSINFNQFQSIH